MQETGLDCLICAIFGLSRPRAPPPERLLPGGKRRLRKRFGCTGPGVQVDTSERRDHILEYFKDLHLIATASLALALRRPNASSLPAWGGGMPRSSAYLVFRCAADCLICAILPVFTVLYVPYSASLALALRRPNASFPGASAAFESVGSSAHLVFR